MSMNRKEAGALLGYGHNGKYTGCTIPELLDGTISRRVMVPSMHQAGLEIKGSGGKSTVSDSLAIALLETIAVQEAGAVTGKTPVASVAIGSADNATVVVEVSFAGKSETYTAIITKDNRLLAGKVNAGKVDFGKYGPIGMNSTICNCVALLEYGKYDSTSEFSDRWVFLKDAIGIEGDLSENGVWEAIAVLTDNLYYRMLDDYISQPQVDKRNALDLQPAAPITEEQIKKNEFGPTQISPGSVFSIWQPKEADAQTQRYYTINGEYPLREDRVLTERERLLVPVMPDSFIIPKYVMEAVRYARSDSTAFRNYLFYGPPGTGKTTAASAVAAALNLPQVIFTCDTDTNRDNLLGSFAPLVEAGPLPDLPSLEDMIYDPDGSYLLLTGETQCDGHEPTVEDCERAYQQRIQTECGNGFTFVESAIVQAIRYGWVVEIQEPTVISSPAALSCLHSLLDGCQEVTLPTGEIVRRHPDSIVIATTNVDCEGTRRWSQAFGDRFPYTVALKPLTRDEIMERVSATTGFPDLALLREMADIVLALAEKHRNLGIRDGEIGYRSLEAWARMTLADDGNPADSVERAVIDKSAWQQEDRDALMESFQSFQHLLRPIKYPKKKKAKAKKEAVA